MSNASLTPVLRTLQILREHHVWLEITHLMVPGTEAEEEFRKCSRLTPSNPVTALAELHKRFVENGNTIRAHMLAEEIKKLIANQQATAQNTDK